MEGHIGTLTLSYCLALTLAIPLLGLLSAPTSSEHLYSCFLSLALTPQQNLLWLSNQGS